MLAVLAMSAADYMNVGTVQVFIFSQLLKIYCFGNVIKRFD